MQCSVKMDDEIIAIGNVSENIYQLDTVGTLLLTRKVQYSQLIHHCFGHVGHAILKTMIEKKLIGVTTKTLNGANLYETCSG